MSCVAWSFQPSPGEERRWLDEAIAGAEDVDVDPSVRAKALQAAAHAGSQWGDYEYARPLYKRSLILYRELGDDMSIARVLAGLGLIAAQGEPERARALYKQSLALYRGLRDLDGEWIVLNNLGELERAEHEYERATELLEQAVVVARKGGDEENVAMSLHGLGDVALDVGDVGTAFRRYHKSLEITRTLEGRELNTCYCLAGLAAAAAARRDAFTAGLAWGALEALEDELGARLPTGARSRYAQRLAGIDEAALAVGLREGRMLTLDAAVERTSMD